MKRIVHLAIFLLTSLSLFILSGCVDTDKENNTVTGSAYVQAEADSELHLAIILGAHANAAKLDLTVLESDVYDACISGGSVTLICDDGDPYVAVIDIPEPETGLSNSKYIQIATEQTEQILNAASEMRAKTDQIDTVKSIQLSARSLSSAESENGISVRKKLIMADSSIPTTGFLDLSDCNLDGIQVEEIIAQMQEAEEIPDLTDVEVDAYFLGDVAGDQPVLTEKNRQTIRNLWSEIFEAASAKAVNIKNDLPLSEAYDSSQLPAVNIVPVSTDSVEISDSDDVANSLESGQAIQYDDETISFEAGTANFADVDAASKLLRSVYEYMVEQPDFSLIVVGTTACWNSEEYCKKLSQMRAETVCSWLENAGIDADRLTAVGLGYSYSPFYVDDQNEDGSLNEEKAQKNRAVWLVDRNSSLGIDILSQ